MQGLTFTLPKGWVVQTTTKGSTKTVAWEDAKVTVPDPKYHVTIPVRVMTSSYIIIPGSTGVTLLKTASSGAKIYAYPCSPAIACY